MLDKTFEQLNLEEKDYFGLRFVDNTGQTVSIHSCSRVDECKRVLSGFE